MEYDIYDDTLPEENERFSIDLLRNGAEQEVIFEDTVSFTHKFTIIDNDVAYVNLEDQNVNVTEPVNEHSLQNIEAKVLLSEADKAVSVDYATESITATEGRDYNEVSGTLNFAPGEREKTFQVPVHGDNRAENTERFRITLSNPVGAELRPAFVGQVTISDSDPRPTIRITANIGRENNRELVYTINPSILAEYSFPMSVSTLTGAGTATEGVDFQIITGEIIWLNKLQESVDKKVALYNDSVKELPESFEIQVLMDNQDNYHQGPNNGKTTAWIVDDDNTEGFVVTVNNDASRSVRKKHFAVTEGGSKQYQIWLTEPPTSSVRVNRRFTGPDRDITTSSPASHTFNDNNWTEPYRVTVEAAQDSDTIDGMRTSDHTVVTDDPFYQSQSPKPKPR